MWVHCQGLLDWQWRSAKVGLEDGCCKGELCFLKGTKDIPLMSQLTGFQYQRFVKHIELYESRKGRGSSSGLNVDLDQNPSHASLSWALNPLITHGHIAFVDEGCLMTGEEHFLAQMEATPNACPQLDIPSEWRSPLSEFIKSLARPSMAKRVWRG